ncbi:hypothetical protein DICVIV_05915 [Dictyocaulus viviparus]|uniref:Uncharacterized protein n=1 Tax=Dictyocaulus viviparus TaxID=29172 RepID=A0A0D8XTX9_DICVI|nr:hypothetical protein DICVIV_05915 [Dictyocaulus viviparus]
MNICKCISIRNATCATGSDKLTNVGSDRMNSMSINDLIVMLLSSVTILARNVCTKTSVTTRQYINIINKIYLLVDCYTYKDVLQVLRFHLTMTGCRIILHVDYLIDMLRLTRICVDDDTSIVCEKKPSRFMLNGSVFLNASSAYVIF